MGNLPTVDGRSLVTKPQRGLINSSLKCHHCGVSAHDARMPGNIDLDGAQCDLEGSARDIRVVYRTRSHIGRWLRYGLPLSPGRSFQTLRSPWSLAGPASASSITSLANLFHR